MSVTEKDLLEYFSRPGPRSARMRDLVRALRVPKGELRAFRRLVRRLRREGRIPDAHAHAQVHATSRSRRGLVGTVQGTRSGVHWLIPEDGGPDLRIASDALGAAVHGDVVRARARRRRGRLEAVVEEIVERARRAVAGTLEHADRGWVLVADDERIGRDIVLQDAGGALEVRQAGHKALVRLTGITRDGRLRGTLVTVLGPPDQPGVRSLALRAEFDLPEDFPPDVQAAAGALVPPKPHPVREAGREDLTSQFAFTIDPVDARDHDDAVSITRLPEGGFELGVHIADVAHYVLPESALDEEARHRATSVYLADGVVPMLPENLSNHVCSLRPGVVRLALSALLRFGIDGARLDHRLTRSCIVSRAKLSYEAAAALVDGRAVEPGHLGTGPGAGEEPPFAGLPAGEELHASLRQALEDMRFLARRLRARRFAAGALEIDTPEYRVEHDERGRVVDIHERAALESYTWIEEFMLAANRAVAETLHAARMPLLWRIHDPPDYAKVDELRRFLRKLGLPWDPEDPATHQDYQRLLRSMARRPERRYLMYRVLRSLQKARYDPRHRGHFGLAFSTYTHFTSPIRRYPDLYNHRLVGWMLDRKSATAGSDPRLRGAALAELARHCSERELVAAEAERASIKLKVCEWLVSRVGETVEGFVSGISEYGLFVDVPDWRAEGFLPCDTMPPDSYHTDAQRTALFGSVSGRVFRFGQRLRVRLVQVDPDRRRITLCLAA